jgi:(R,R)-butanediol dehydrogenase/meso-butanediol dehydrogenase/diacetyl reductase
MKALVYHGKEDLRLDETAEPVCREDHAIVEVRSAGICGSDLTVYLGKHPRARAPVILGHEFSGVVVDRKGDGRPDLRVGDRVTVEPTFSCGLCRLCRSGNGHVCLKKGLWGIDADGAFARFVAVPLNAIYRLPESASFEEGALVEPLAVAVRALAISKLGVGECAVVLGAGPIGLLTAQTARVAGAGAVVIVEPIHFRRQMAERMGFPVLTAEEATLENVLHVTAGREIDVVFDAAGAPPAALLATALVRRTGRIILTALYKGLIPYDLATVSYGEIQIFGTCIYTFEDFGRAVSLLESGKVDLLPLVTHRLALEEGPEIFKALIRGGEMQKVLFSIS